MHLHLTSLLLFPLLPSLVTAFLNCRPDGPVLPKPTSLQNSPVFELAAANLTNTLNDAINGSIAAGWAVENVSFSLAVVSLDQADPGIPIWEFHHQAKTSVNGTKKIDRDSQYLIASISKVLTVYIMLMSDVNIDDPVTEFLPELGNNSSTMQWQNITLRMLASHLAGVPANVPMERPAYSNAAFNVLAMALEAATGKNYTQMVKEMFSTNLGMKDTLPSPGCDNKAVIPSVESNWGTDFGYSAPSGGLVSTTSDLSKFTHRLLARSLGLSPTQTRQWLKPDAFGGSTSTAVGMPWEIFRPADLVPQHPHPITIYGKNGGALGYRSQISVLDEYGIALIVLSAGAMNAQPLLTDAMLAQFVPAIDEVSRKQADHDYARNFGTNCNGGNSSGIANITFKQDIDSLTVSSFHLNGSDMLASIPEMWNLTMGQYSSPVGPKLRLFPSDMVKQTKVQHETLTSEMWLLWPELIDGERSDLPGAGLEHANCMTWAIGDWVHYGGQPIDRVLFYRDENGKVVGFEAPFLRTGILRP
ncbi:Beta-lactamase-like protein [Beauveria bassiana]|nr:Beta-lactamase-like protein [Beauveria bassiana]